MILKALYDYYNRCKTMPSPGMEEKEIGFLIVISKDGHFVRLEDCRIDKNRAKTYLVKKHIGRTSVVAANYLYDNAAYVLGYSEKEEDVQKNDKCFSEFKGKIDYISSVFPDNEDINAIKSFYGNSQEKIIELVSQDPLWEDIKKNLSKKYSVFSFRIDGDLKIVAEKKELLQLETEKDDAKVKQLCLVTGKYGVPVETTTATMIANSQATAKLVAFQVNSGYDSYGKSKCANAPISEEAEFAYTTALNTLLGRDSRNKFILGNRTFVFWASSDNEASVKTEDGLFALLELPGKNADAVNIMKVKEVFKSIYSGQIKTTLDDKFYILGLAPNSARIAVVYWAEITLKEFAGNIMAHFTDMEIYSSRKDQKPYQGIYEMISKVTLNNKLSDATPNLSEAVVKSVFQGLPYPFTLYSSCIRRICAEHNLYVTRVAIIKAYLNRLNDNTNKKINIMLDKENTNQGYLCGRLFAVLDKIQEEANNLNSIRDRYMNAASSTPSSVFATILNLSNHHAEKLNEGRRITFEKIKQEIFSKFSSDGFPAHLDLQDQGRFFVGYYQQREDFFAIKKELETII